MQDQQTVEHAPSVRGIRQAQECTTAEMNALCTEWSGKHETPGQPESLVMTEDQLLV